MSAQNFSGLLVTIRNCDSIASMHWPLLICDQRAQYAARTFGAVRNYVSFVKLRLKRSRLNGNRRSRKSEEMRSYQLGILEKHSILHHPINTLYNIRPQGF